MINETEKDERIIPEGNLTTNLAAVVCVWMCVSVQNLTNFCPHVLISNPNVPKILFVNPWTNAVPHVRNTGNLFS